MNIAVQVYGIYLARRRDRLHHVSDLLCREELNFTRLAAVDGQTLSDACPGSSLSHRFEAIPGDEPAFI